MGWEKEFDERLGEIKRLMEKGEATKEEAWQLQKLEHTVLIYDLMMKRVLEEKCLWDKKDKMDSGDAKKKLINHIEGLVDSTRAQISETVNFCVQKGHIRYKEEEEQIRWEWIDFL
jgi:hypothetical protein